MGSTDEALFVTAAHEMEKREEGKKQTKNNTTIKKIQSAPRVPRLLGFGQRRVEGRGEKTIAVESSEMLQPCCNADPIRFRDHPR
jgi:hypothetical protein